MVGVIYCRVSKINCSADLSFVHRFFLMCMSTGTSCNGNEPIKIWEWSIQSIDYTHIYVLIPIILSIFRKDNWQYLQSTKYLKIWHVCSLHCHCLSESMYSICWRPGWAPFDSAKSYITLVWSQPSTSGQCQTSDINISSGCVIIYEHLRHVIGEHISFVFWHKSKLRR